MEIFVVIVIILAFAFAIDHAPSYFKKRSFRNESGPLFRLHNIAARTYDESNNEFKLSVGMAIYHFFEEMWKEFPTCAEPDELFERYLYNSSSRKLNDIFRLGFVVQSHPAPTPNSVAISFFACACKSACFRRDYANSKIDFYVVDATKDLFNLPFELCPTLQIFMWQKRFKEVQEKSPLHPFYIEYTKPDHKTEEE
jgi:hypothetical protein